MDQAQLNLENGIKKKDLELRLKEATSLSEEQIQEIVPVILNTLKEIQNLEKQKTENATKNDLKSLSQAIENDSDVKIEMTNNKWTVIWAMNINTITNNISITINQPRGTQARELRGTQAREPREIQAREPREIQAREPRGTQAREPREIQAREPREIQTREPREIQAREPREIQTREPMGTQTREPRETQARESQSMKNSEIKLDSYEWYDTALSQLIYEIEWCIKTAKYKKWLNKSWKETLKTATEKLKQYKDIMNDKRRMLNHEYKEKNKLNSKNPDKVPLMLSISGAEIDELKNRRFDRRQKIEIDIKEGQNWKTSNVAPWPNQSLEQVKGWNKVDRHHIEYDSKLNAALNDAAFLRMIDNNQDRAREFLQAIANNSLSDVQITFCQMHRVQLDPYFEKYGMMDQVHRCIQTCWWKYTQSVNLYWNIDWETAYKTWWLVGWLNNTLIKAFPNAKPDQVSSLTNVAVAAGWIYAIYRIWKWFFSKDEKWERHLWWKIAWLAWIYFVPQLLLGKDWFSLLWEILSGKADFSELKYRASNCLRFMRNSNPEVYNQMVPWVLWMNIFPQDYTVSNMRALQQTFSDQNARKQWYSVTYNRLNKDDSALANEFKNTFNENQYNEDERNAFLAKLWITDETEGDVIIFNEAAKLTDKKTSLELRMKSQWKKKNPAFKKEIDEYLKQEWEFDPERLNPNWFNTDKNWKYTERQEDIQFKETLSNQIDSFAIDLEKKTELKSAVQRFYDERAIDSKPNLKDFDLKMENGFLILTSHNWQETKIKIDTNEIESFWHKFSDLSELLNVADLSNKILDSQKWKVAKDMPPFQYKIERKWICFNDATCIRQDIITRNNSWMDTRVLSTWRWWATSKIDTLSKYPEDFAKYLSDRWIETNKLKINLSLYPTIKWLSESWITFINEQEVKQAETRLNKVKQMRSMANGWTPWYKPFSIEWNKLVFSTSDTQSATKLYFPDQFPSNFAWKSQNLSDFPTILKNKDKFLNYMNDRRNWMWWSKLN